YDINDWHALFMATYQQALMAGAKIIITGGEPLLQQPALVEWQRLFSDPVLVEVETNGTILPFAELLTWVNQWNVSPKLSNSGETKLKRWHNDVINFYLNESCAVFKFVVKEEADIEEIFTAIPAIKQLPLERKYLMPAADNRDALMDLYPKVIDWVKIHGFTLGQRLHIDIWNQKTGV
ncbi:MAG: hypothetical protein ACON35_02695, partial [Candidatus Marinamargulisbacteria bacterium]